jgi:hypothetical protein
VAKNNTAPQRAGIDRREDVMRDIVRKLDAREADKVMRKVEELAARSQLSTSD